MVLEKIYCHVIMSDEIALKKGLYFEKKEKNSHLRRVGRTEFRVQLMQLLQHLK